MTRRAAALAERHYRHLAFAEYARDPHDADAPRLARLHARWLRGGDRYLGAGRATAIGPPPPDWRAGIDEDELAPSPWWGDPLPVAQD